ncbi:MAG: hypothetical protein ACYDIC_14280 [Desulfobaccales bacterium]
MAKLLWETVDSEMKERRPGDPPDIHVARAKVPGGWLVRTSITGQLPETVYLPDPNQEWQ